MMTIIIALVLIVAVAEGLRWGWHHEAENAPGIVQMCRWLAVSKSGYYE
jgi:hypothetical protein